MPPKEDIPAGMPMAPDAESVVLTGTPSVQPSSQRYNMEDDAPEIGSPTPDRYR